MLTINLWCAIAVAPSGSSVEKKEPPYQKQLPLLSQRADKALGECLSLMRVRAGKSSAYDRKTARNRVNTLESYVRQMNRLTHHKRFTLVHRSLVTDYTAALVVMRGALATNESYSSSAGLSLYLEYVVPKLRKSKAAYSGMQEGPD